MNTRSRLFLPELALAVAAFGLALVANYLAGTYVTRLGTTNPSLVQDLLLCRLPRVDLHLLFIWGFAAFFAFACAAGFLQERARIPYILWMYALLVATRAFFMILTPMGVPPGAFHADGDVLFEGLGRYLTFRNDLFFSAHTAMPFLGYLIYRRPRTRMVFLAFSIGLALCVLLCRMHYSIDVMAAYFITYALVRAHRRWIEPAYVRARRRVLHRVMSR